MLQFTALHPRADDLLGYIPEFLDERNPMSARVQLDANYAHGGGWQSMKGWTILHNGNLPMIVYPGDPPMSPIAYADFREERVYVYPHAWVMILQKDGTFEIARMD